MTALAHPPSAPFTEHELTQAGIAKVAPARDTHREGVAGSSSTGSPRRTRSCSATSGRASPPAT